MARAAEPAVALAGGLPEVELALEAQPVVQRAVADRSLVRDRRAPLPHMAA